MTAYLAQRTRQRFSTGGISRLPWTEVCVDARGEAGTRRGRHRQLIMLFSSEALANQVNRLFGTTGPPCPAGTIR